MTSAPPCQLLQWDTEFFGFPVARVLSDQLTAEFNVQIDDWCRENRIACLYFSSRGDDPITTQVAARNGYELTDLRMTFENRDRANWRSETQPGIIPARPEDLADLMAIASNSHRDTRFYFDQRFSRERCSRLYSIWIEKSCTGSADAVWVAENNGKACGYVTCKINKADQVGNIGLIAVADSARGRGTGSALIRQAMNWFADQNASNITVVTQGRNVAAQRLYQRLGFVTRSLELTYHKWFYKPAFTS